MLEIVTILLNQVMLHEGVLDTGKYKKNEQRVKTPKLGKAKLWFLHCTSIQLDLSI
jgi:hypothetical protein